MPDNSVFRTIGICGGGKMGVSFFKYLSALNDEYSIIFYIRNPEKLEIIKRNFERRKRIENTESYSVGFTKEIGDLGACDVIFEFVSEDINVKQEVLSRLLEVRKNPSQILASGTSSFTPARLSANYGLHNIIGVHFIYPVQLTDTVEIIHGDKTSKSSIQDINSFIKNIGKKPVNIDDKIGCITTRVLIDIKNEAFRIHKEENIAVEVLDRIIEDAGFTPPPFSFGDYVGLDIIYNCLYGHYEGREEFEQFASLREHLKEMIFHGCLGKKSGRGFYDYSKDDSQYSAGFELNTAEQIDAVSRIKMIYINSSFKLLDRCFADCSELDRIFHEIDGTGVGPAELAFKEGLSKIFNNLNNYYGLYGCMYKSTEILDYAARHALGREEIDRQIRDFNMGGKRPDWHSQDII